MPYNKRAPNLVIVYVVLQKRFCQSLYTCHWKMKQQQQLNTVDFAKFWRKTTEAALKFSMFFTAVNESMKINLENFQPAENSAYRQSDIRKLSSNILDCLLCCLEHSIEKFVKLHVIKDSLL